MPFTGCLPAAEMLASRWRALLVALLGLLAGTAALPAAEAVLAGRVVRVVDGDTLDVLLTSGRIRVRLHGVDAPERGQPGGQDALLWLSRRVLDHDVLVEPISQDRYERLVGIVYLGGDNVNRELLRSGNAWAYRHYLRAADAILCDMEAAARTARLGLWKSASPRAPWEYRSTRGVGPFTDFAGSGAEDCRKASPRLHAPR